MGDDDVRRAVRATRVVNAGPDADDERRIAARQEANRWSYGRFRRLAEANGVRMATTPNGMLIAAGGNAAARLGSHRGGTTWGDVFLLNAGRRADPAAVLRLAIRGGVAVYEYGTRVRPGVLPLDRLLCHEEIHARQWARMGPTRFPVAYLRAEMVAAATGRPNRFEVEAGLADGGYSDPRA
ncbi:hypothetical protein [Gordonia crocea]|uniref:DUF4157 domain-containing protein n=1 Tax=Gordonia crocea TaxID=589162 RepID=A0A7I9V1T3_9ACTN|nr:hypothetical protein [Gordonia crocea]GED99113.1 hypothetical protein nbrc107697_31520 [Gordonia crocea]